MYDRILFPTDGSDTASDAFDYAMAVASAHEATVRVLHVADTTEISATRIGGDVVDAFVQDGQRLVEEYATRAEEAGLSVVTDVHQGHPAETIVAYADEHDVELVVMPTHGRSGLQRYLVGSVTERVLSTSPVPVLTITPSESEEFVYPPENLLVPTDGSQCADAALDQAVALASVTDSRLHLLTVVETAGLGIDVLSTNANQKLEENAAAILDDAEATAREASVDAVTRSTAKGRAYREIHSYLADTDVDLAVVGTHGESPFESYVLGGVTNKLIRTSPVPVMVVPDTDADRPADGE